MFEKSLVLAASAVSAISLKCCKMFTFPRPTSWLSEELAYIKVKKLRHCQSMSTVYLSTCYWCHNEASEIILQRTLNTQQGTAVVSLTVIISVIFSYSACVHAVYSRLPSPRLNAADKMSIVRRVGLFDGDRRSTRCDDRSPSFTRPSFPQPDTCTYMAGLRTTVLV